VDFIDTDKKRKFLLFLLHFNKAKRKNIQKQKVQNFDLFYDDVHVSKAILFTGLYMVDAIFTHNGFALALLIYPKTQSH